MFKHKILLKFGYVISGTSSLETRKQGLTRWLQVVEEYGEWKVVRGKREIKIYFGLGV